jgi:hypothetical protein
MKRVVEHTFTGATAVTTGAYDPTKTMIGSLFYQSLGSNAYENFIAPVPYIAINLVEAVGQSFFMPHVVKITNDKYWVFVASNATAAATRNIGLFEFDKASHTLTWKGFITLSGTTFAGNKTIRALRGFVYTHSDGTVDVSGTSVTGDSTKFSTDRIAVGARIGFGSKLPEEITTWYEIGAIGSDTSITLTGAAPAATGVDYVIQEIRVLVSTSNVTLTNGSPHLIKGLNYDTFTGGGTIIPEATTVDNIRASYLLKLNTSKTCTITNANPTVITCNGHGYRAGDVVAFSTTGALPTGLTAGTAFYYVIATDLTENTFKISATQGGAAAATSTAGSGTHTLHSSTMAQTTGLASDEMVSVTEHAVYQINLDAATFVSLNKLNIRAALTVAAGEATGAVELRTFYATITGTAPIVNNGRLFTLKHLSATGRKSVWFVTSTRVYRCDVASITDNATGFLSDVMIEIPPYSASTYAASSLLSQVDYSESLDRIIVPNAFATRFGVYIGQYDTSGIIPFDKIFGGIRQRLFSTATDTDIRLGYFPAAVATVWSSDGLLFSIPAVVTTGLNILYIFPFGVDALYADSSKQYVITPKLSTANATALYRAYVNTNKRKPGSDNDHISEPVYVFYRVTNIDDNDTDGWVRLGDDGDLSSVIPGDAIQFKFAFEILGDICIPTKLHSVACVYEDESVDAPSNNYLASADLSDRTTKTFAWKHSVAFGTAVPRLKIRLYNAVTDGILDTDDSVTQTGTWEKTTDGGSNWAAYDTTDKGNEFTFIRFTPASIPDNVQVRALLTLY